MEIFSFQCEILKFVIFFHLLLPGLFTISNILFLEHNSCLLMLKTDLLTIETTIHRPKSTEHTNHIKHTSYQVNITFCRPLRKPHDHNMLSPPPLINSSSENEGNYRFKFIKHNNGRNLPMRSIIDFEGRETWRCMQSSVNLNKSAWRCATTYGTKPKRFKII